MSRPADRLYAKTHEWVKLEGGSATLGITDYAQEQLGDVVFVELPAPGRKVVAGAALGTIESVKAVSELFSPVTGSVTAINTELEAHPELLNQDPFGAGWLVRLEVEAGAGAGLLDLAAYERHVAEEGGH